MVNSGFRHIFLHDSYSDRLSYTRPQGGGDGQDVPRRSDVQRHGRWLRERLDIAWEAAGRELEGRRLVSLPTRDGTYLEFLSDPGVPLISKSLEDLRQGVRLLNVTEREVDGNEAPTTYATVFVPAGKRAYFLRKISAYETEHSRRGDPKNRRLVDSIADIRTAIVESFWTDTEAPPQVQPMWCEVWLRTERDDEEVALARFRILVRELGIDLMDGVVRFPERDVVQVLANRTQLETLIFASDDIAEFRRAKETAEFWINLVNADQAQAAEELGRRLEPTDSGVSVCLLDTGVNRGHPLLSPLLSTQDCHTVKPTWGVSDQVGHGTLMAGTAAYGDMGDALASTTPVRVVHRLESSKILRQPGNENPRALYGYLTAQAISRAEIRAPERKRICCLAISSVDGRDRGRPSSWSGEIDALAAGVGGDDRRLIVVAAGNTTDPADWRAYPNGSLTNHIHDPAQAWNALTVGAWTQKTLIVDPDYTEFAAVAPSGSISPFTTTSLVWEPKWPNKPDFVMEGGNAARDQYGDCSIVDDLALVSTYFRPMVRHFAANRMTSAATALAANFAARLQAAYPDAWPETVRALMVHSAEWSDEMRRAFLPDESKSSYSQLLRICGYGVPNFERAVQCASSELTLIAQRELRPFERNGSRVVSRDMHIHELPWPREVLEELGEVEVTLRVTLSYFVEPGPGEIGWRDRYRYASHGLRFDLNSPGESRPEFLARLNTQARDDEWRSVTSSESGRWTIGSDARHRGSIHSDIWRGPAVEIAQTNLVGVTPVTGWWKERQHLGRWDSAARYSLVVSLTTEQQNVDIYTPVANLVGITIPVTVEA